MLGGCSLLKLADYDRILEIEQASADLGYRELN